MTTVGESGGASPAAAGTDVAWIAYVLHAIGYLSVVMWPAVLGLVINYIKRGEARGGFVDSHHDWMIRTFWYGLLWHLLSLGALLWSAWPVLHTILQSAHGTIAFDWHTIFAIAGAAALGCAGIFANWVWLIYRVARGAYRLANSQPVP